MASAKPPRPPSFDDATFSRRLYERVRTATGGSYAVFRPTDDAGEKIGFPRFTEWLRGLRDTVNANALYLDAVKGDVDSQGQAILELRADVEALKEAPPARPFP